MTEDQAYIRLRWVAAALRALSEGSEFYWINTQARAT